MIFINFMGYGVQLHLASPVQILGTAPGFGCKKTLKYPAASKEAT